MLNLKLLVGKPAQNVPGSIGSEGFARSKLTEGYLTFSRAKPVTSQVLIIYIYCNCDQLLLATCDRGVRLRTGRGPVVPRA